MVFDSCEALVIKVLTIKRQIQRHSKVDSLQNNRNALAVNLVNFAAHPPSTIELDRHLTFAHEAKTPRQTGPVSRQDVPAAERQTGSEAAVL